MPDVERHLDVAARQFSDPEVWPWHWPSGPRTREQAAEILAAWIERHERNGFGLWWWRERQTGELVGWAGLNPDQVEGDPVVEVGWSLDPAHRGNGHAIEGSRKAPLRVA